MQIDLEPRERIVLGDLIEGVLSDLRMEIADTDSMDFREKLKERKAILIKLLEGIREG
jgi:hypothetical protein